MDLFNLARHPRVGRKVVAGSLDCFALRKPAQVLDQQFVLQLRRVIKVQPGAFSRLEVAQVAVIVIEAEMRPTELAGQLSGEGSFAGAGCACDGNQGRFQAPSPESRS